MATEEDTRYLTNEQKDILEKAIEARANLVGPTCLNYGRDGSFSVTNGRSANCLPSVSKESEENMVQQFQNILTFLDKSVEKADRDEDAEFTDDRNTTSFIETPWFKQMPLMGSVYQFQDLTYQLMPNRSACLILDVINGKFLTNSEWTDPSSNKLTELCATIDEGCINGTSCVYTSWFPHVNAPGPRMLPQAVTDLLTRVPHVASTSKQITACFSAVYNVLGCKSDEENDEPDLFAGRKITRCVCCMVVAQLEELFDRKTDCVFNERIGCVTLLGISDLMVDKSSEIKTGKASFFQPSINIHGEKNVFPSKDVQLMVKKYTITRDDTRSSGWRVTK